MIFLLAGVIIVTAFAALIAQMSLLLRLKPGTLPKRVSPGKPQMSDPLKKAHLNAQPLRIVNAHHRWWLLSQIQTKWLMQSGGKKCSEIKNPGLWRLA